MNAWGERDRGSTVLVVGALVASVGVAVGSAGPWGSFGVTSWDMDYHRIAAMLAGVVAALALTVQLYRSSRRFPTWTAFAMGAAAWAIALVTVVYFEVTWDPSDDLRDPTWCQPPRVEWGLWLTTLSSVVLMTMSLLVAVRSQRLRWLAALVGLVVVAIHVAAFIMLSVDVECAIQ